MELLNQQRSDSIPDISSALCPLGSIDVCIFHSSTHCLLLGSQSNQDGQTIQYCLKNNLKIRKSMQYTWTALKNLLYSLM